MNAAPDSRDNHDGIGQDPYAPDVWKNWDDPGNAPAEAPDTGNNDPLHPENATDAN